MAGGGARFRPIRWEAFILNVKDKRDTQIFAAQIRIALLEEMKARGFGHIGGSLSICDLLAVLYGKVMNYKVEDPKWADRDKLVVSKGHAGPAVYATLALKGFFPMEELKTLNRPGTNLPSHCDKNKTPGVDCTTGSLGQGTSQAVGMALGDSLKGRSNRVFLVVGEGELDEGQCWEAAMFTAAKKVNNLVWIIDDNKRQLDGYTQDIIAHFDLRAKFEAFGFDAVRVPGNDVEALYEALTRSVQDKPIAIIMDNVKGSGVKAVEETQANHSMTVDADTWDSFIAAVKQDLEALEKEGCEQ
ncbi:MAG: transketolase [Clostridia bacterium]|nr:transketolase [Clostridia bacterium]